MILEAIPPGAVMVAGGVVLPALGRRARAALVLGLPLLVLWLVWQLPEGVSLRAHLMGYRLELLRSDALSRLFATIFTLMTFGGGLYAYRQARTRELASAFVYAGAALGVVFAGDLLTLFVWWEVMAVASTMVVWSQPGPRAVRAGMRYLLMHLFGGVVLMTGIAWYAMSRGDLAFHAMHAEDPATWLILCGFLLNAGAPPFSAWLPDAYPEASSSGAVFLSAFTTKTAVYVLLRGFPGEHVLIWVGLYMALYGIVYALLENDMRRILAYSIVNQVGFMVTGIGIGTPLALDGAAAHAFAHIIYKALLLMSAGSVLHVTGRRKCTDLGGLVQSMPFTALCGIIGALAISAFPLTSGFVSKSMISQAAADAHLFVVWLVLAAASAGVFLHAGIKFPWFVFFQRDSGLRPSEPPLNMRVAMGLFAALCVLIGIFPQALYALLPYPVAYHPYTGSHVVAQMQLLLFSGLAFFVMLPWMRRTLTISLDTDWAYRRVAPGLAAAAEGAWRSLAAAGTAIGRWAVRRLAREVRGGCGPAGLLALPWSVNRMVAVVIGLFVALLAYILS